MNVKNKILTLLLLVAKINCGDEPVVLNEQEKACVVECMNFMRGALLPMAIAPGMPTAFSPTPASVNYPFQLKNEPFGDRIRALFDRITNFLHEVQNPMLYILIAFMYEVSAKLEPEKEAEYLAKAREFYRLGTSDESIQQIVPGDREDDIKMRQTCSLLKMRGLANLSEQEKGEYDSIKWIVSGFKFALEYYKMAHFALIREEGASEDLYAQKTSIRLIERPLDNWNLPMQRIGLILATLNIVGLQVFAPFINQINGTTNTVADVSISGKSGSLMFACDRLCALSQLQDAD